MRLLTRSQSQTVDQLAQEEYGLDSETLMESAGAAVAEEVHLIVKEKKKRILILIGPGNNGADAFVVARLLKRKGFQNIHCVLILPAANPSALWKKQKDRAQVSEIHAIEASEEKMQIEISEADYIIDGVFGTGLNRTIPTQVSRLFELINRKNKMVIAIDAPSGLNVDTGWPQDLALKAQITVTFGLCKPGFYLAKGPSYCGRIKRYGIGFPDSLLKSQAQTHFAFGARSAARLMPKRPNFSHKGTYGHVEIVGSSVHYPGAGILASKAAGRAGAGYVTLSSFGPLFSDFLRLPEVIYQNLLEVPFQPNQKHAFVVGPGLGGDQSEKVLAVIQKLIKAKISHVLLDADALNVISDQKEISFPPGWVLTPHPGELSRLMNVSAEQINRDRSAWAMRAAQKYGCIVCLKGFRTVVATSKKSVIVLSGNSSLSKAGAGDVLSGIIGAFLAQGLDSLEATLLGVYLHGRVADEWVRSGNDKISLLPSDLIDLMPQVSQKIRDQV